MPFKIPLQSEVAAYIKEKMKWPDEFCQYYAEKFWSHYQSNGWKVSGKAAMKDWTAAFASQWKTLKWKEDIDKYNELIKGAKIIQMKSPPSDEIGILDRLMGIYIKHPADISLEKLGTTGDAYETIKKHRLWPPDMTKQELKAIADIYPDEERRRGYVVERTFKYYGNHGWNFSDTISLRQKQAK